MAINRKIISASITLMQQLQAEYGAEESMRIWERLTDVIENEDLKFEVFKVLMTGGKSGDNLILTRWNNTGNNKIAAIKCLRYWTSIGLEESKNAIEDAEFGHKEQPFSLAGLHGISVDGKGNNIEVNWDRLHEDFESVGLDIYLI